MSHAQDGTARVDGGWAGEGTAVRLLVLLCGMAGCVDTSKYDVRADASEGMPPPADASQSPGVRNGDGDVDRDTDGGAVVSPRWTARAAGDQSLHAIWGESDQDFWVVGGAGTLLHTTNGGADFTRQTVAGQDLFGIAGRSAKDIWIVGDGGLMLHGDGAQWTMQPSGVMTALRGIAGSGPQLYAVGDGGTILRGSDAMSWSQVKDVTQHDLHAVWGAGAVFVAVGAHGEVVSNAGGGWSHLDTAGDDPLDGVWGSNAGDLYAVSRAGKVYRTRGGRPFSAVIDLKAPLHAVWGSGDKDVYTVGDGGAIFHFTGADWAPEEDPSKETLRAVWGMGPSRVIAAGRATTLLRQ